MEKREEKINKKKIDAIVKSEKEKWASLKKHQEEKKLRANRAKYDKFLVKEPNLMRILVIGESCSGKTCLIKRYIKDEFSADYITTLTIEAFKSELLFYEDASYRIELIDTPPLENFYKFLDDVLYFVQGVILVFDASNKNAFLRMQDYFKMINFYNFQKIGIIATKKDICTENDKYKYYQLKKFCQQYKCLPSFLSSKNTKEDISNFIDILCPEIIPSLVNKKEDLKLMYPYTKSIKNDFPKKNMIDEAILKKAKEDDFSYESEHSQEKEKDREDEIREYYLKKRKLPEKKKTKPKPNYIYNIGNNKKYQEDNDNFNYDIEEKKDELQSFNNVIGNVNLDLEKLFEKYRPDSASSKDYIKKNKNKYKKDKNKTIEDDDRNWVNVNIDSLVQEFLESKRGFKKKEKKDKKSNKGNKSSNNVSKKSIGSKKKENDKEKSESKISKKSKNENENEEEKKDEEESKKGEEIKKEEEESKKEESKKSEEEKNNENKIEESEKSEKKSEEKNNSEENNDDEDDEYENLYGDIYKFQQNALNEAMEDQEHSESED